MQIMKACPIGKNMVDENVSRLNALFTVVILILYLITPNIYLLIFLVYEYLSRSICIKYSIIPHINRTILHGFLKIKEKPVNALPKKFASFMGAIFAISLVILYPFPLLTLFITLMFMSAAALEAFLNLCVGCIIYNIFNLEILFSNKEK